MSTQQAPAEQMTVNEAGRKGGLSKSKAKREATLRNVAIARAKRLEQLASEKKYAA